MCRPRADTRVRPYISAAAEDPPDDQREGRGDRQERRREQPHGAGQNRLGLDPRLELQRRAVQAVAERLLPDEDAAAFFRLRIVRLDLARQMQPERDELAPVPADFADVFRRRRTDLLLVREELAVPTELVGRPRERRRLAEAAHIGDVQPDVHEAPAGAPGGADPRYMRGGRGVVRPHAIPIDRRRRVRIERGAAQGIERGDRGVDVDRRAAVEGEIHLFLVLVLAEETGTTACGTHQHAEHAEHAELLLLRGFREFRVPTSCGRAKPHNRQ